MQFKKGAKTGVSLQPEIINTFPIIDKLCAEYNVEAIITSGVEGRHKSGSKHYDGMAIDLRSRHFEGGSMGFECASFCDALRNILGPDYDVVQEDNHIHLEYDPKG